MNTRYYTRRRPVDAIRYNPNDHTTLTHTLALLLAHAIPHTYTPPTDNQAAELALYPATDNRPVPTGSWVVIDHDHARILTHTEFTDHYTGPDAPTTRTTAADQARTRTTRAQGTTTTDGNTYNHINGTIGPDTTVIQAADVHTTIDLT